MKVVNTIAEMKQYIGKAKSEGKSIGLVPTMGFLHEGHLSLIERAKEENDVVTVSIFVNPTQFNVAEDLNSYPRNIEQDLKHLESKKVDFVFAPEVEEMYPYGYSTFVDVEGGLTKVLCGKSREGHFKGVATVVSKLFNIISPDKAYFGQKDAQQIAVIKRMTEDLNLDVKIVPCPIIREKDGLALSSRNSRLEPEERKDALILSKSLFKAKEMIEQGEKDASIIRKYIIENINTVPYAQIDYVEIVNGDTFENIKKLEGNILIALAVQIGKPRLIDNISVEV